MTVKLPTKLKDDVSATVREFGFKDEQEFVEEALHKRILELRKRDFLAKAQQVRQNMERHGVTEQEIVADFEKFRHNNS